MIGVSNEENKENRSTGKNAVKKLRVAAHCRVSTKYESQRRSIELQKAHYEKFIQEQPNWLFAGVYVDYGSRCRITKRTEFQKMIQRALNGELVINEQQAEVVKDIYDWYLQGMS